MEITKELLQGSYKELADGAQMMSQRLTQLAQVGGQVPGMDVLCYEGQRRLEEFMHRVGDICRRLEVLTPESMAKMTAVAAEKAGLKLHDGGLADA